MDPLVISKDVKDSLLYAAIVVPGLLSFLFSLIFFSYIFIKWCLTDWNCVEHLKKIKKGYSWKEVCKLMLFNKPKKKFVNMNLRFLMLLQFSTLSAVSSDFLVIFQPFLKPDSSALCRIQSITMQFFNWTTFTLILVIAFWLFCCLVLSRSVVKRLSSTSLILIEILCYIFVLIIATIFTILPATTESYGNSGLWCWIPASKYQGANWQMASYYVPLWIIILVVSIIYGITLIYVFVNYWRTKKSVVQSLSDVRTLKTILSAKKLEEGEAKLESLRNEIKAYGKLIFTPLTFLLIWIIPTVNRLFFIINNYSLFLLSLAHLFITNCHAICIVVVFFFDPIEYFKTIRRFICCYYCKKKKEKKRKFILFKDRESVEMDDQQTDTATVGTVTEAYYKSRRGYRAPILHSENYEVIPPPPSYPTTTTTTMTDFGTSVNQSTLFTSSSFRNTLTDGNLLTVFDATEEAEEEELEEELEEEEGMEEVVVVTEQKV